MKININWINKYVYTIVCALKDDIDSIYTATETTVVLPERLILT